MRSGQLADLERHIDYSEHAILIANGRGNVKKWAWFQNFRVLTRAFLLYDPPSRQFILSGCIVYASTVYPTL